MLTTYTYKKGYRRETLPSWYFLELCFNHTKSFLLVFLLSNYLALARHRKRSIPNQSTQKMS